VKQLWIAALIVLNFGLIAADEHQITANRRAALYLGPGHTYFPADLLNPGLPVQVVERDAIGTWVRVQRVTEAGDVAQDGWLQLGYLNLTDDLRFSEIPVNTDLPPADLDNVDSRSMRALYAVPVIPEIDPLMVEVFERGQQLGRGANVVTKVGDSLSADRNYLAVMSADERELGPFDYLSETIDYYGPSTAEPSVAARIGLSSLVLFDPFWADDEMCGRGATPLTCEYDLKNPSVALIMFGPNDVLSMSDEEYGDNMRRAVEETLAAGVIPVLSTFSYHPDHEYWWLSVEFNLQLVAIAQQYRVPLINLWSASRVMPDYGMDQDRIHMKQSGFAYLKYDTGHETFYGTSLRNLLAVRTLHEIRLTLNLGEDT
jgi:hypothetical protein